jgi:general L-amino acid transport system permease protein
MSLIRRNFAASPLNLLISLGLLWLGWVLLPPLLDWAVFSAVFRAEAVGNAVPACRAEGAGACWAIIPEKAGFLLFGPDGTSGLVLTLALTVFGALAAFPLAVLLALGRRSRLPVIRALAGLVIETIRGVPLITLLFMASFLLPLFLPGNMTIPPVLRVGAAFALFMACYLAEAIRGGLQAVPRAQEEAAKSLGFNGFQTMSLIVLPRALRVALPAMIGTVIGAFKDTSLVLIVGLFDIMQAARSALADTPWRPYFLELYLFVGLVYFAFALALALGARRLEYGRAAWR